MATPRRDLPVSLIVLALLMAVAPPPAGAAEPAPPFTPTVTLLRTPTEAMRRLLALSPRVLGFGEYHQLKSTVKVPSALKRFTASMLPELRGRALDLIVETWVTAGDCGKKEVAVVKNVEKTIERPPSTESELVTLLRTGKEAGLRPHILRFSCPDYNGLLDDKGEVDYEKLLRLITRELQAHADKALPVTPEGKIVVLYGGGLHNDLQPLEELRPFTFGPALRERTGGRYLEVDLYVPEYIQGDAELAKQPWFPLFKRHARKGRTLLIQRGPASYIVVFPRT